MNYKGDLVCDLEFNGYVPYLTPYLPPPFPLHSFSYPLPFLPTPSFFHLPLLSYLTLPIPTNNTLSLRNPKLGNPESKEERETVPVAEYTNMPAVITMSEGGQKKK